MWNCFISIANVINEVIYWPENKTFYLIYLIFNNTHVHNAKNIKSVKQQFRTFPTISCVVMIIYIKPYCNYVKFYIIWIHDVQFDYGFTEANISHWTCINYSGPLVNKRVSVYWIHQDRLWTNSFKLFSKNCISCFRYRQWVWLCRFK